MDDGHERNIEFGRDNNEGMISYQDEERIRNKRNETKQTNQGAFRLFRFISFVSYSLFIIMEG
jgi:hypothetical protein